MTDQTTEHLQDTRRHSFFIIDNAILDDYALTPYEFTVYAVIVRRAGNSPIAWPGMASIAKDGGMSVKQVERCIKVLEEKKLLSVNRSKKEDGSNAVNIYTLIPISGGGTDSQSLPLQTPSLHKNTQLKKTKDSSPAKQPAGDAAPSPATPSKSQPKEHEYVVGVKAYVEELLTMTPPSKKELDPKPEVPSENGDWQPRNVFEFVLEKLYAVQYSMSKGFKVVAGMRGHTNKVVSMLKGLNVTVEELTAAWAAYPQDIAKPRGADAWAGMVMRHRENGAPAGAVPELTAGLG